LSLTRFFPLDRHDRKRVAVLRFHIFEEGPMKKAAVGVAGLFAAVGFLSHPVPEAASAGGHQSIVPRPIAGGDYFPDLPHHRAGIIHQFYPVPVAVPGGDGPWAEPNEITDFNGFIAQVFMGGTAVDGNGNQYNVDVDNRVYQGEYIGTNGKRGWGTFCET
jgi:hypothetical protein